MKKLRLLVVSSLVLVCLAAVSSAQSGTPDLSELKLVTQVPAELPQRTMGLAYDGEKLWVSIYLGQGRYGTLDPATLTWSTEHDQKHYRAIREVAGAFASPGGLCFANGSLWIAGSYGESFGSIDLESWKVNKLFKGYQRTIHSSQSYSSITFDGQHLWLAWHATRYDLPASDTQLLLKVNREDGSVVARFAAPAGTQNDMTHGLTWDGSRLWHMKDRNLSAIDPVTGQVVAKYALEGLKRPSGLAWANDSLWISEFEGKIWRLPFRR